MSFTRSTDSGCPRKTSRREDRHIWCHARGNLSPVELNQVVFSDESRFNLNSDGNRIRVWRHSGEHLNPAFALQRHTASTAGTIFQEDNDRPHSQDKGITRLYQQCYYPSLDCPIPRFVSNQAYLVEFGTVSWASHEFEGARAKVAANMERNVSKHHTELLCLNARSYLIVHSS
ncbi:transposable element Tcb1 transposase [Trichonephila clavipes]|nr:transposable element Tcb1 transposase [Trichonephila clavipes]